MSKPNKVTFGTAKVRRYDPYNSATKPENLIKFLIRMMSDFDQDAFNGRISDNFIKVQGDILKFKSKLRKEIIKQFPEGVERDVELDKIEQSLLFVNVRECAMHAQIQHAKENQPMPKEYPSTPTDKPSFSITNPSCQVVGFSGKA